MSLHSLSTVVIGQDERSFEATLGSRNYDCRNSVTTRNIWPWHLFECLVSIYRMNGCGINSTFLSNTDRVKRKHHAYQYGAQSLPTTTCGPPRHTGRIRMIRHSCLQMAATLEKVFATKIMLGSPTTCTWRNILFIVWLNQVGHLGGNHAFYFSSIIPTLKLLLCWTTELNELTKNLHP